MSMIALVCKTLEYFEVFTHEQDHKDVPETTVLVTGACLALVLIEEKKSDA